MLPQGATRTLDRGLTGLWTFAVVVLGGLAAYRFFHLAVYPIYRSINDAGDFVVFYQAAELAAGGKSLYPYPGVPTTYLYPPTLALLLMPLVGRPGAFYLFITLAFLAVVASVGLLSQFATHSRAAVAMALGLVALAAWPVHLLLRQGQVDAFTLLLMVAALWLVWRARPRLAALALGAAISLKVTPAILVPYFLWKRRYRLALESLAAAAAIVLVGGLLVGPGDLVVYVTQVLPRISSEGHAYWYNQSIHALFLRLFATTPYTTPLVELGLGAVNLASAALALLLLAIALAAVRRRWPSSAPLYLAEAGAFVSLEVATAGLSWQMHAVWLLVPVAALLLVATAREEPAPTWLAVASGLAALGFLAGPYEPPIEYGRFTGGWSTLLISHTLADALVLLALCLYVARTWAPAPALESLLDSRRRTLGSPSTASGRAASRWVEP